MSEQTDMAPQELLQGEALTADIAAKAQKAHESADRVLAVLQTEFDAMLGIAPGLRADYMFLKAHLTHGKSKI